MNSYYKYLNELSADLFKPHMDSVVGFPGIANTSYPLRIIPTVDCFTVFALSHTLLDDAHACKQIKTISASHYVSSVGTCRVVQGARWCLLAQLLHITQSDSLFYTVACWDLETLTHQSELLFISLLTILGFCRVFVSIQVCSVKTHMVLQSA